MRKRISAGTLTLFFLSLMLTGLLYGCVSPLKVDYNPVSGEEKASLSRSVPILIKPFTDKRAGVALGADPLEVGSIDATVQDMYGARVILSTAPATLMTEGFKKYLRAEGYTVVSPDKATSSFSGIILSGEIREFSLHIGPRDNIDIELYAEFKDNDNDAIIWSGLAKEKDSIYAGVFGDSKKMVSKYISGTISKVFGKIIKKAGPGIKKMSRIGENSGNRGSTVNQIKGGTAREVGRLIVKTLPARAEVYINGVYYGLTPMTLKLRPGIYRLILKKDGFNKFMEKIALGSGRATEMETTLKEEK